MKPERPPREFTLSADAICAIDRWYRAAGLIQDAPKPAAKTSKPKGRGRAR